MRWLPFALLLCLPFLSFAQPIHSWPDFNSWWELRCVDEYNQPTVNCRVYHMYGDTVIQGLTYQKLGIYWGASQPHDYAAATRSDSMDRVWVVPKDSLSELLLYDFNVQPGDTIFNVFHGAFGDPVGITDLVVNFRDTINLLDGPHVRLTVYMVDMNGGGEILDGVGIGNDPVYPMYLPSVSGIETLECMSRDTVPVLLGNCVLLSEEEKIDPEIALYPNPSNGQVRIEHVSGMGTSRLELFSIAGKRLQTWDRIPGLLDLGDYSRGIYLLQFEIEGKLYTERVLKY
jgi:hypothetical protein